MLYVSDDLHWPYIRSCLRHEVYPASDHYYRVNITFQVAWRYSRGSSSCWAILREGSSCWYILGNIHRVHTLLCFAVISWLLSSLSFRATSWVPANTHDCQSLDKKAWKDRQITRNYLEIWSQHNKTVKKHVHNSIPISRLQCNELYA